MWTSIQILTLGSSLTVEEKIESIHYKEESWKSFCFSSVKADRLVLPVVQYIKLFVLYVDAVFLIVYNQKVKPADS